MGALCAAIEILAAVIPFAQGLGVLGTVPMGLLAYRYRPRALMAATVAGGVIAFLIAGLGSLFMLIDCAWVGGLCGIVKRKGRGLPTVALLSLAAGVLWGAGWVAVLAVLTRLRHLFFDVITANANGVAAFLNWVHLQGVGAGLKRYVADGIQHWPLLIFPYMVLLVVIVAFISWSALSRLLERMRKIPDVHKLDSSDDAQAQGIPVGPVPVRLDKVRFRYPGAERDALSEISLDVQAGEHIAVTGANGSGKTTLMLILAGRAPTAGSVERPGTVGLGEMGGTAIVLQHPKSQVLGTRVADDVVWGLPPDAEIDVDQLLHEVGLEGLAERDTGSLSGGELQRLALAAALARDPALLIADEVTTMVDQQGRDALLGVLSGLAKRHQTALVHITHYDNEAASADRIIKLSDSRDNTVTSDAATAPAQTTAVGHSPPTPVLELIDVGHEYASGTPWSKVALRDISFAVDRGDGVLIHGGNGSGKSTLAWIMAGLTTPTAGTCLIDGEPTHERVGEVALSFQSARLQLMRDHVDAEVASAAGFSHLDTDRVAEALISVGLDPAMGKRRIDQLSGGQMRRVVLAGLLARSPRALVLDEPLAGLDIGSQRGLLRLLENLRKERGLTVVVISHDIAGLEELCPRALFLRDGMLETASTAAGGMS
ncbi:cobalt ABC transporter ATP-binding protein [Mycobacterium colombiense]|uniref:Cobalt ABC transporter ATP-binding protein n=2 Tax=Mycobacterium colombiense TaxID=339268 RepID=A0A1A2RTB6_9MYCO|nr:ABC transporter ATP-binding protein [Mycobacterium colombiense]OBH54782.1 cobalt ABC transporter ATP-binding protein [Mycobacterium colombiense]